MMRLHYMYHGKLCIFRARKRLHLWRITKGYLDGIGVPVDDRYINEWW